MATEIEIKDGKTGNDFRFPAISQLKSRREDSKTLET